MQIGGLTATPVTLGVNQPSYFLYRSTDYYAYSGSNGYETDISYYIYPACGGPFQSIAGNENFDSYQIDYTGGGFNWQAISQAGAGFFNGFANTGYMTDRIKFTDPGGCNFVACVPTPSNYVGGSTPGEHASQTWYTGSANHYSGVLTHTDRLARFTDHGEHQ